MISELEMQNDEKMQNVALCNSLQSLSAFGPRNMNAGDAFE